jgi:branched-chain amino acid transport system permease protein
LARRLPALPWVFRRYVLKGDYLAIVTLGFNEIIKGVIQNAEPLGAQRGLGGNATAHEFLLDVRLCGRHRLCRRQPRQFDLWPRIPGGTDDEIAAEAMGINTTKYKVLAFVLGAFFAGIAGGLYAHFKQFIHPEGFNFMKSVDVVVMVILGGMGSTVGVCIAATLLTILPELLRYVSRIEALPDWLQKVAENRMILYSLLLIILMLTRPQGLFGSRAAVRKKA